MQILTWNEYIHPKQPLPPLHIAIGVFDGVHLGHQKILETLQRPDMTGAKGVAGRKNSIGAENLMGSKGITSANGTTSVKSGVITFCKNPKEQLKRNPHGALMTQKQQLKSFEELGIDLVVMVDFSPEFSRLSGHTFMSLLTDATSVGRVVIGEDFCCGHNRDLDAVGIKQFLAAKGTETDIVSPLTWQGLPVSSTRIRKAVAEGCFQEATYMLGKPFSLDLTNTPIQHIDNKLVVEQKKLIQVLPPCGSYCGMAPVVLSGGAVQRKGASCKVNIEVAPRYVTIAGCSTACVDTVIFLGKE